jgi:DNA polymerase-3 subunit alpha
MKFENYELGIHGVRLPEIEIPQKDHKAYLEELCYKGLETKIQSGKIPSERRDEYVARIKREIDVISRGGFVDYVLLVWDIIRYCDEQGIPKGAARGSSAGSLVLHLTSVTEVDPIEHELYFERFLNEARLKKIEVGGITYVDGGLLPDVDMDFSHSGREQIVNYLLNKYAGKSCKLSTFSTLQGKILIKECGKIVAGLKEDQVNEVSSMIPTVFGKVKGLDEAREDSKDFNKFCQQYPEVYQIAKKLAGLIKNKSSHASGYLVSYYALEKYLPLELGSSGEVVSAYDMHDAQKVAIKVDLLGLQDVTLIANVCKSAGIDIKDVDYNAPEIYDSLQNLTTPYGLFQIGADTNFKVLKKVKPRNLTELAAVVSLARPGALAYVDQFAKFVETGEAQSVHPFFDEVLKETGQIPIYQEQAMRMVSSIGFTLSDAETVRRIVGKKKIKEMAEWEGKVKDKVKEKGLDPKISEVLWKVLDDSKSYSFNKSHAISYSLLAAYSLYLKQNYPTKFFIESLKLTRAKQDPVGEVSLIQQELMYYGIKLLPPDIVKSDLDFKEEDGNIRFGLSAIKGVSEKTFEKLKTFISSDKTNKFEIFQAAKNAKLNIGVFCALIQAGAMGSINDDRTRMVFEAQVFNLLTEKEKAWVMENGETWKYDLFGMLKGHQTCLDAKGKPVFKETRIETLRTKSENYRQIYNQNRKHKELSDYIYEKILAGYSYSHKLSKILKEHTPHELQDIIWTKSLFDGERATIAGIVKLTEKRTSKNKKKYCKITLEDEGATSEFLIFDPNFSSFEEKDLIPKEGEVVIVNIKKWNDASIIEKIDIVSNKVYMKLADLKHLEKEPEDSIKK